MKRFWLWLKFLIRDPAALPEDIGTEEGQKHHRPIPIELGFYLHADGKVYTRSRWSQTVQKVDEGWAHKMRAEMEGPRPGVLLPNMDTSAFITALVHREYQILLNVAKKEREIDERRAAWRRRVDIAGRIRRARRQAQQDIDTENEGAV